MFISLIWTLKERKNCVKLKHLFKNVHLDTTKDWSRIDTRLLSSFVLRILPSYPTKWLKGSFEKSRKYGQPTEWTHSHIIGKNEVNKGISKSEFQHRRLRLMENLQKLKSTGTHILIIPASKRQYMIEKIPYFYRWEIYKYW